MKSEPLSGLIGAVSLVRSEVRKHTDLGFRRVQADVLAAHLHTENGPDVFLAPYPIDLAGVLASDHAHAQLSEWCQAGAIVTFTTDAGTVTITGPDRVLVVPDYGLALIG